MIATLTAAGLPAARAAPDMTGVDGKKGAEALVDHLLLSHPHRDSLEAIGEAYWRDGANQRAAWPDRLQDAVQAFLHHLDLSEADLREMPPAMIGSSIRVRTARDFAEARIVPIQGWLLGETEARLCAIAALRTA